MTVCAQYFEIPGVGSPVLDAPAPCPCPAIGADLRLWPNVVQFEESNVSDAARDAFAAKVGNQLALNRPITFLPSPVRGKAATFSAAITVRAGSTAIAAGSGAPSTPGIAFPRTVLRAFEAISGRLNVELIAASYACSVMSCWLAVGRQAAPPLIPCRGLRLAGALLRAELSSRASGELLSAFLANVVHRFHREIVSLRGGVATYFDIACKRIEKACAQPDMFVEASKDAVAEQLDILTGAA